VPRSRRGDERERIVTEGWDDEESELDVDDDDDELDLDDLDLEAWDDVVEDDEEP
jgi:hypothetical protein